MTKQHSRQVQNESAARWNQPDNGVAGGRVARALQRRNTLDRQNAGAGDGDLQTEQAYQHIERIYKARKERDEIFKQQADTLLEMLES